MAPESLFILTDEPICTLLSPFGFLITSTFCSIFSISAMRASVRSCSSRAALYSAFSAKSPNSRAVLMRSAIGPRSATNSACSFSSSAIPSFVSKYCFFIIYLPMFCLFNIFAAGSIMIRWEPGTPVYHHCRAFYFQILFYLLVRAVRFGTFFR